MSKIALSGNASGTGTFSIVAPNSNTDRTLTLPDEAGTVLTSASSIPVANLDSAVGITEADQWVLTADITGDADIINSNLQRFTSAGQIGTGMSVSSGVWTFPSTGIWEVTFNARLDMRNGSSYANIYIYQSTDGGSTYTARSTSSAGQGASEIYCVGLASLLVDVTSTTDVKIYFRVAQANNSNYTKGSSSAAETHFTFIRLGDT